MYPYVPWKREEGRRHGRKAVEGRKEGRNEVCSKSTAIALNIWVYVTILAEI